MSSMETCLGKSPSGRKPFCWSGQGGSYQSNQGRFLPDPGKNSADICFRQELLGLLHLGERHKGGEIETVEHKGKSLLLVFSGPKEGSASPKVSHQEGVHTKRLTARERKTLVFAAF